MIASLLHFLIIFLARHWLVGLINGGLTLTLGLALLRAGRRIFSQGRLLQLRYIVLVAAFFKGAFFLIQGDSQHARSNPPVVWGVQLPDPIELLYFTKQSRDSIWHPTSATELVSTLLVGLALTALLRRVIEMIRATRALAVFMQLDATPPSPQTVQILKRAAQAIDFPPSLPLPTILLAEVQYPTPMLLGLRRPWLMLAPSMMARFSDSELEMAFRHELSHLRRRDQWGRWLLTWIEDCGCLSPLTRPLGTQVAQVEELLCDRLAVHSPQDAQALAGAITKASEFRLIMPRDPTLAGAVPPADVSPSLWGRPSHFWTTPSLAQERLEHLLLLSQELSDATLPGHPSITVSSNGFSWGGFYFDIAAQEEKRIGSIRSIVRPTSRGLGQLKAALFWLLFVVVLYLKYYMTPDVN